MTAYFTTGSQAELFARPYLQPLANPLKALDVPFGYRVRLKGPTRDVVVTGPSSLDAVTTYGIGTFTDIWVRRVSPDEKLIEAFASAAGCSSTGLLLTAIAALAAVCVFAPK